MAYDSRDQAFASISRVRASGPALSASGGAGPAQDRPVIFWQPGQSQMVQTPITKRMAGGSAGRESMTIPDAGTGWRNTTKKVGSRPTLETGPAALAFADEAAGAIYEWYGTKKFDQWGDLLVELGLVDEEDARDLPTLDKWWRTAVEDAARFYQAGQKINPWSAIRARAGADGGSGGVRRGGGSGGREPGFTGSRTATSRSSDVDLTDPATAKALVHDVLSQALGRRANDDELSQFAQVLAAAERAAPRVTTTSATTTFADGIATNQDQSSTTTGGMTGAGRQDLLLEEAMQKPEYGAYQAAAVYFPVLQAALGATAG